MKMIKKRQKSQIISILFIINLHKILNIKHVKMHNLFRNIIKL